MSFQRGQDPPCPWSGGRTSPATATTTSPIPVSLRPPNLTDPHLRNFLVFSGCLSPKMTPAPASSRNWEAYFLALVTCRIIRPVSWDAPDSETGVLVNLYGAHLFHTKFEDVWNYVQQFSGLQSFITHPQYYYTRCISQSNVYSSVGYPPPLLSTN